MSKYFLVPDLHGELDMAIGLLQQEGILDENYDRISDEITDDLIVIQIGDFLNCVGRSIVNDNRCLDYHGLFDILLVGNHEHPYFGGPAFAGFQYDPVINHRLKSLDARGIYKIAVDCDGILVSHAGIVAHWYDQYFDGNNSSEVAGGLNFIWKNPEWKGNHELFSSIGWERQGWSKWGSILWADWNQYKTPKLTQIVGHSVGDAVRLQYNGSQRKVTLKEVNAAKWNLWEAICIDLGAGKHSSSIVGVWIEDGNVRLVEYRKEENV